MKKKILTSLGLISCFLTTAAFAQTVPPQRQASGVQASQTGIEADLKLRKEIKTKRASAGIDATREKEIQQLPASDKVLITRIEVAGNQSLTDAEVRAVVAPFENKTLSIREMQEVADRLTDAYRQKGFITSRATLPPQKVENGVLKIQVIEGKMGALQIQGNKHFSTALLKRKIELKAGDPFNYDKLQQGLARINQSPDRKAKTVLTPGKDPGTTDLVLNVQDKSPIHAGVSYDNYGSEYLRKNRYQGTLTDNNLLGFDDILTLSYQAANRDTVYNLQSLRYLFPLTNSTLLGFYAGKSQLRLGKEYEDVLARGKSKIYSVYITQSLVSTEVTDISWTTGFDYKDVFNFQMEAETSRDRMRVVHTGFKFDHSDSMGRTIVNNDVNVGVPGLWGGLDAVDIRSSRPGISGGKFTKNLLDVVRLQKMPWESTLLLKAEAQTASRSLTATEQFQIGGIANVRAYPTGEVVGDDGQSATAELSFPVYPISKSWRAPLSKASVYDALRLAVFYDWAKAESRTNITGQKSDKILSGYGTGVRYDLPENFSVRFDLAWPLEGMPSDLKRPHAWLKISKDF